MPSNTVLVKALDAYPVSAPLNKNAYSTKSRPQLFIQVSPETL